MTHHGWSLLFNVVCACFGGWVAGELVEFLTKRQGAKRKGRRL
jgi:hypothetical protein